MIRSARPTLAEVRLADLSFQTATAAGNGCFSRPDGVFFCNGIFFNNSGIRPGNLRDGTNFVALLGETRYCPGLYAL